MWLFVKTVTIYASSPFVLFLLDHSPTILYSILSLKGVPRSFSGRHFIFSFPYPPNASSVRPYLIATAQTPDVQTEVRFELPALGCSQLTMLGYREVALFNIPLEKTRRPPDELGSRSGLRVERPNDTVIVQANHSITLQCGTANHADRFLVFPSDALGVEYLVASSPVSRSHQFTVSTTRDDTKVNITTRVPVFVNGADIKEGHIELELDIHGSIHVSSLTDLTGVRVTSNYPLSVVSGSQLDESVLAQQLPPVKQWGRKFILARSGYLASSVLIYRIVVPQPNTTLSISSSSVAIDVRTGDTGATWYDHSVQTEGGLDTLSSDKAVMVVRYTLATALLITPVELYTNDDSFELMTSKLPEPVSIVLNVAYLCGQEHNLSIRNDGDLRPFRNMSLSSLNEALCIKALAFRHNSGDGNQTMHIRGQLSTATFVWVDTGDAEIAGSYRVAATMQFNQPANQPIDSCPVIVSSEVPSITGMTTPSPGEVYTSKQPTRTLRPNRSDDAAVIVPLCVSVAVVLAIIAGLCYFMKKNKMFPVCQCKTRRAYDVSNAGPADQTTRRKAAPSPEVIPLQNRYSVSLPDLRPMIASREHYPSGQHARFLHMRLAPIAENEVNLNTGAPANCDARMVRHNTFQQPVGHTYFSFNQQPGVDHRPPPDPTNQVRQPPNHGIPEIYTDNMQATDRSATGQFASIGRRRPSSAKPIPVQLVFNKPEIESQ
ncbi:uncharacterized protein LOC119739591 [Patiria miniata]|uniref:IgGFc-binding protein N-terminal domain-containing protein n=1 Tax=Patiria miniata TaxID=46514 RepID=A0A914B3K4_PATMI|nr:uncharacterized protein LOC119739591 [Patiria miniata]